MPRSCLLGDPYEVRMMFGVWSVTEVGNDKIAMASKHWTEDDAKAQCEKMNNRAFIEEERKAKNDLDHPRYSNRNRYDE